MHNLLIVAEDSYAAQNLRKALGHNRLKNTQPTDVPPEQVWVTFPGESIIGRRVGNVVMPRELYLRLTHPDESRTEQMNHQWWRESLQCRILPGGTVVTI